MSFDTFNKDKDEIVKQNLKRNNWSWTKKGRWNSQRN